MNGEMNVTTWQLKSWYIPRTCFNFGNVINLSRYNVNYRFVSLIRIHIISEMWSKDHCYEINRNNSMHNRGIATYFAFIIVDKIFQLEYPVMMHDFNTCSCPAFLIIKLFPLMCCCLNTVPRWAYIDSEMSWTKLLSWTRIIILSW